MELLLGLGIFAGGIYIGYKYQKSRKPAPEPYVIPEEPDDIKIVDPILIIPDVEIEPVTEFVKPTKKNKKKEAEVTTDEPPKEKPPSKKKPKIEISK